MLVNMSHSLQALKKGVVIVMDDDNIKSIYNNYIKEICHYSKKQVFATSHQQKNYFQYQIDEAANSLYIFLQEQINNKLNDTVRVQAVTDSRQKY